MLKKELKHKTLISRNISVEGETLETKIERIITRNEPIKDGAPLIYTERKEGVLPGYDVRTDRFDVAIDAMDKVSKSIIAKREDRMVQQAKEIAGKITTSIDTKNE